MIVVKTASWKILFLVVSSENLIQEPLPNFKVAGKVKEYILNITKVIDALNVLFCFFIL